MSEGKSEICNQLSDSDLLNELARRVEFSRTTVQQLQTLNAELQHVNEKLKVSEALKSHFISNITNEIINPFTSIIGLSRSILSVDKESWKKVISMVALIHSEAFNLDFQFRNIFFAAKFEAGEEQPTIIQANVREIFEGVLEDFRYELRKRKLKVKPNLNLTGLPVNADGQPCFKTDPSYLRLVLANLLSNAINFTADSTAIEVSGGLDEQGHLQLSVRDYGIGIAKEKQQAIFDRFTRASTNINSLSRGHGLGLSVCKAIADMLNGTLSVKSAQGEGATFTFTVPESENLSEVFAEEGGDIFFDSEETF